MNITIFNGSPKGKNGYTNILSTSLTRGFEMEGARVENIFLKEKNIRQCAGCLKCWFNKPGKCIFQDDMDELIDLILKSDMVGFATPVFDGGMTAIFKNFIDRQIIFNIPPPIDIEKKALKNYPPTILISTCGFYTHDNFDILTMSIKKDYAVIAEICRTSSAVLDYQPKEFDVLSYKNKLVTAGREIVKYKKILPETMQQINQPLLSEIEFFESMRKYFIENYGK